eukprot:COSAG06_NODE_2593_length_6607_cov_2.577904_1_plen_258_part_10
MWTVRKTHLLRHCMLKLIILPRRARDKHRENSKRGAFFAGRKRTQLELELQSLPQSRQGADSWAAQDSLIKRAEDDGIDAHALIEEMLSYEYGDAGEEERGGGNQSALVLPKPLREKREREAKMREDCAEIPQNILLKNEASMSSTSIREQLASFTLQAVCKRAKEEAKIDAHLVRVAKRAEDPQEAVVALILEKAKAVDSVIQQNRRLIDEIMKRQLSEIRAEVVEGSANIQVLAVHGNGATAAAAAAATAAGGGGG